MQKGDTHALSPVIELQVKKVEQLFHTLDPQPFRERDLDRDAEEFIVSWARELPLGPLRIAVRMPAVEAKGQGGRLLGPAIRQYFTYRALATSAELRELLRTGQASLMIGLSVLAASTVLGSVVEKLVAGASGQFIQEGLVILGWVANWRPIEIYLYDWWPIVRRRRLLERLGVAEVTINGFETN